MAAHGLVHGPLGENCIHLCVDMQRLFGPGYPWAIPWLERILPSIEQITRLHPERTLFTRFIPAQRPGEGAGAWSRYYERWADVTLEKVSPEAVRPHPVLERFVPPAMVLDKRVYFPWAEGALDRWVSDKHVNTVIISGGEN